MNCAACGAVLAEWERPQRVRFGSVSRLPPGLCDGCARASLGTPGTAEALERLGTGKLDEAEVVRVFEATSDWVVEPDA